MSVARLLNATDWIWDLSGMGRTWVDVPSDFGTEAELPGRNKERAAGSSSSAGKSGVSVIIASSSSDSCNK